MLVKHYIDQTTFASRQAALAWKITRWSMWTNIVLIVFLTASVIFGVIKAPWYVAATNDIHPHLLRPYSREEVIRMVDKNLPPVDTKGPRKVPLDDENKYVETGSVYLVKSALNELDELEKTRDSREYEPMKPILNREIVPVKK